MSANPEGEEGLYEELVGELVVEEFVMEGNLPSERNESNTEGPCELQKNIDVCGGGRGSKSKEGSAQRCAEVGKRTNEEDRKQFESLGGI